MYLYDMIFLVKLVGIPIFWVKKENLTEKTLTQTAKDFDFERGKFGFNKLNKKKQMQVRDNFCKEYDYEIIYHTSLDRELKIRERSASWLQRRLLEDMNITISARMLSSYCRGTNKPKDELKKTLEIYLSFKWI